MTKRGPHLAAGLIVVALVASWGSRGSDGNERFTLIRAVPNDVFLCMAGQHNPEREFLDKYWGEVFQALRECGIGEDALALFNTLLGVDHKGEIDRLKERASQLAAGVDWGQLVSGEVVFAERLAPPLQILDSNREIHAGTPPNMVWLSRGSGDSAAENFDGLVAILEALTEEVNRAVGGERMAVDMTPRKGTQVASINLLAMVAGAPRLPIAVGQRDDIIFIAFGEQILADVLGLLDGSGLKKALADDPRFKAAFAQLPPAEDSMVFFNMQALLKQLGTLADAGVAAGGGPGDVILNTRQSRAASLLTNSAVIAYQKGDIEQALTLTKQAHELAPSDSIVLYNLACFHALSGQRDEALSWLEKAVAGGFYAPAKISGDSDLQSLRDDPRYEVAFAKAVEMSARHTADDIVINSSNTGEARRLSMQAWDVYKSQDYEQGLRLIEQAYEVAPNDSRVLYYLACFHALLGHDDQALSFLRRAVDAGFYCPRHISRDPDLESIRADERYEAALETARERAAGLGARQASGKMASWKRVVDRLMNAVGVLDYVAAVESTEGYTVWTDSIAALVPDAKSRPIYPVFGKREPLTDFDRYLPEETVSFSVSGGFDLGELYKFIEETFHVAGPPGEELLAKWVEFQEELGLDVQQDIFDWLDGDFVSVTLAEGRGSVWLIKVSDEQAAREKVAAAIKFLSTKLAEVLAKQPALAMLSVHASPVQQEQLEGFENLYFAMSPQPLVWGVADGHLILGTSADAVALCLETAHGRHPNVRENARVMGEALVPSGPFTSVTLTDQRRLGEELAMGIGMVSMFGGMAGAFIPDPEARPVIMRIVGMLAKLTPVVRKIDFYKSTAAYTTFDGQAWHTRQVTHYVAPAERAARAPQ